MKHLARIFSLLILVSAGLFIASCGGSDPNPTSEEETQFNKLKGSWEVSTVTGPNGVVTGDFDGMIVTFGSANGTYSYSSTPPSGTGWPDANPWLDDSDWEFGSILTTIIATDYDPEMEMSYDFLDANTLQLEFDSQGQIFTNGRTKSVQGTWTFVFEKQ